MHEIKHFISFQYQYHIIFLMFENSITNQVFSFRLDGDEAVCGIGKICPLYDCIFFLQILCALFEG